jgi:magnesium-transporting ATPase (P-type)
VNLIQYVILKHQISTEKRISKFDRFDFFFRQKTRNRRFYFIQGLPQTAHMISSIQLRDLQGVIECELPNRNLYEFAGTLKLNNVAFPIPLGSDQILLRGSQLKNTAWIYGLVIYSGHETKLMMVCIILKKFFLYNLNI